MKHKNLLKLMAVVMILAMAMTMLIACGEKDDKPVEPPKPTFTAKDAAGQISEAIVNSLGKSVDVNKAIGFEYSVTVPGDDFDSVVNVKGILDGINTQIYLDFVQRGDEENRLFSISTDKDHLYFDSLEAKKKFDFDLAGNLAKYETAIPGYEAISGGMIGQLPSIVFDMIMDLGEDADFEHEEDPDFGTVNTIHGSFAGLSGLIGGVVDGIIPGAGAKLGEFLAKVNIELTVVISNTNKEVDEANLVFTVDGKELDLAFTSKLANVTESWKPAFYVPSAKDTRYLQTKLLNFVMDGEFNLDNGESYTYDIVLDIDPFEMLDKAVLKTADGVKFDVTRILDITSGGFYVNVANKATKANVASVAYAPGATDGFGNQNIYMNIDLASIIPDGILEKTFSAEGVAEIEKNLVALKADIDAGNVKSNHFVNDFLAAFVANGNKFDDALIDSLLAGKNTITFDVKALLNSAATEIALPAENKNEAAAGAALENYNPLKTVFKAFEFFAGITYDYENGVTMELQPLFNAVASANGIITDELAKNGDLIMSTIGKSLVKVDKTINIYDALDLVFKGAKTADIKIINAKYAENAQKGTIANLYKAATADAKRIVSVVPQADAKITLVDSDVQMDMAHLSDKEWSAIMNTPKTIDVTYKYSDGSSVDATAKIVTISGLDLNKKDVKQNVYVIVAPVDGMLKDNEYVAAHQFKMDFTVASLAEKDSVVFTNKIGESYKYGAAIDTAAELKLTYKDGKSKTYKNIAPVVNKSFVEGGKVNALADIKLGYNKFGYTDDVVVKVSDKQAANAAKATVKAGAKVDVTSNFKFKVGATEYTLDAKMIDPKTVSFAWETEPARYILKANYLVDENDNFVLDKDGNKIFTNYTVMFDEVGTYKLTVNVAGGFSKTFEFEVKIPELA